MKKFRRNIYFFFTGKFLLTDKQKKEVDTSIESIKLKAYHLAEKEIQKEKNKIQETNGNCPNCANKDEKTIVNKIIYVNGETKEINHCNHCGNEWKKVYKTNIDLITILQASFETLYTYIYTDKIYDSNYINLFADQYAEAIYFIYKTYKNQWDNYLGKIMPIVILRLKFKSVYGIFIKR